MINCSKKEKRFIVNNCNFNFQKNPYNKSRGFHFGDNVFMKMDKKQKEQQQSKYIQEGAHYEILK